MTCSCASVSRCLLDRKCRTTGTFSSRDTCKVCSIGKIHGAWALLDPRKQASCTKNQGRRFGLIYCSTARHVHHCWTSWGPHSTHTRCIGSSSSIRKRRIDKSWLVRRGREKSIAQERRRSTRLQREAGQRALKVQLGLNDDDKPG